MVTQTPWFDRSFNFNYPIGLFPIVFSRLEGAIFRLQCLLANADDGKCSYNADGWSVKEQVGHLADLEELWWKRLQDFSDRKEILSAADLQNTKTKQANHNSKSLNQLLQEFTNERQRILEVIYGLDEERLKLTALHPRLKQPMRLIDSLYFVAEHDDHHIAIISALLRKS